MAFHDGHDWKARALRAEGIAEGMSAQLATLEAESARLRAYVGRELDACRDNVRVTGRVHCSSTAHAFHRGTEKAGGSDGYERIWAAYQDATERAARVVTPEAERDRVMGALAEATGSNPHIRSRFLDALVGTEGGSGTDGG